MRKIKRVTIKDVAALARVSPATVSHVLNDTGLIGEQATLRVRTAMREIDYRPNIVARGLRSQKTATIGLLVSSITNTFYPHVARGVEDMANQKGYNVILCDSDEDTSKEARYIDDLISRQVDGYLLVPTHDSLSNLEKIRGSGYPIVLLDRQIDEYPVDVVLQANYHGTYDACQHLIVQHGYRELGIITGPLFLTTGHERLAGYKGALEANSIPYRDSYVFHGDFTEQSGYEGAMSLIAKCPGIQALFVSNNPMCIGALKYIKKIGLDVPEKIALVCFDEMPWSALIAPPLTTVSHSSYDLGKIAVDRLLKRLQGDQSPYSVHRIPTKMILRKSCGCHTAT